jgi:hypothetical protein
MNLCSPVKVKVGGESVFSDWRDNAIGSSSNINITDDAHVGFVTFHGAILFATRDKSSRQAKMRAACIIANIFSMHRKIVRELLELSLSLQPVLKGRSSTKGLVPSPTTTVSQHHPSCVAHCTASTPMDTDRTENETDTVLNHHDPTATRAIIPAYELFCMAAIEEQRTVFKTMLEEQEKKFMVHIELLKDQIKMLTESIQRSTEQLGRVIPENMPKMA